ncbi:MAG: bacteriohopanetetrol glucosamine biosynthesis glycosyltransferase HpnI [Methylocystis sp.]
MLFGSSLAAIAAIYACLALAALLLGLRRAQAIQGPQDAPPASIMKPLYGAEAGTYENLRSFCLQDYPHYQMVCGVRDANDPAVASVRRLQQEFPALAIELVVEPRLHGSNHKVSNLINILARCRHDLLVLADSDIRVTRSYLAEVVAPLHDPAVGVVTCLYRGRPAACLWSRLGALFIDDWFAPSVHVAHVLGSRAFAFGATIALRRATLESAGGFEAIVDQLADDYRLGERTRQLGLRTVLSSVVVDHDVVEENPRSLFEREIRWLRTIRSLQPAGFAFSFVTFSLPVALLGFLLAPDSLAAKAALCATFAARLALHLVQRRRAKMPLFSEIGLVAPRDCLSLILWCASFASWRVRWGGQWFSAEKEGALCEIETEVSPLT